MIEKATFDPRYYKAVELVLRDIRSTGTRHVVALARKGPRLFDICQRTPLRAYLDDIEVLTDKSLYFLPPDFFQGEEVAVVDDIAIYGSTLKYVCELVAACGGQAVPYAIAINTNQLNTDLVCPKYALGLTFKQASTFNNSLAGAIVGLGKPFDIDYPIVSARSRIEPNIFLKTLQSRHLSPDAVWNVQPLDTNISISVDLSDYNIWPPFLESPRAVPSGLAKLRFYFDLGVVRIVPMFVFEWTIGPAGNNDYMQSSPGDPFYNLFKDVLNQDFCVPDPEVNANSYRAYALIYYLSAIYVLGQAWNLFRLDEVLATEQSELVWATEDLRYAFGPHVGRLVGERLGKLLRWSSELPIVGVRTTGVKEAVGQDITQRLDSNILFEKSQRWFMGLKGENMRAADLISELFNITYVEHERKKRALREDRRRRLSVGFSIGELYRLINAKKLIGKYELSQALDELVDVGAIVPHFLCDRADAETSAEVGCRWLRAYRYGENGYGTATRRPSILSPIY